MNVLKGAKWLAEATLFLSFISYTTSPITSMLGIQQLPLNNTIDLLKFTSISSCIITVIVVSAIFGFGYIVLTGWREQQKLPKAIRILIAFALGALAFSLSGPISSILPIPFLPTVITTILLWGMLRTISNLIPTKEAENITINAAIAAAQQIIKEVEPTAQSTEILETKLIGKSWKVSLLSNPSTRKYEIEIDAENGGVTRWA